MRKIMKFLFYLIPIVIMSCAPTSVFMGNGIFSFGTTHSLGKAAVSTGADYVIKKEKCSILFFPVSFFIT